MKSAATSREGLYRAYEDDDDDAPTRVGYRAEEAREAILREDLPPSAPITPRVNPSSFFPPDDPNRAVAPPTISGEYAAVRLSSIPPSARTSSIPPSARTSSIPPSLRPIESVPPVSDQTFQIRGGRQRLGNDGAFGFGWMLGLAFMSACTVFVWLWFVARWFVH